MAMLVVFCSSFSYDRDTVIAWARNYLTQNFDPIEAKNVKLKKWELNITNDGFFRLKKYYPSGKQEYFSFNLSRIESVNYLGTSNTGLLLLNTFSDDIIVQTYNDPKGNIDSMSKVLKLAVKNIEPEKLDSLNKVLLSLRK